MGVGTRRLVFLAASPLVTAPPSNLSRLYYNGSAAESYSNTTQYRQLRRLLDCEQSLFFFSFSKGNARVRERWTAKPRARETRACLSRLAPSVTRVVICVSRAFCSTDQEKRETARRLFLTTTQKHLVLWTTPKTLEPQWTDYKFKKGYTHESRIVPCLILSCLC